MTRVRKNLPPLTLRLSAAFVNGKTPVSTGFLRFFLVFLWKTVDFAVFEAPRGPKPAPEAAPSASGLCCAEPHCWREV
jgi:hypothetical protein